MVRDSACASFSSTACTDFVNVQSDAAKAGGRKRVPASGQRPIKERYLAASAHMKEVAVIRSIGCDQLGCPRS